MSAPRAPGASYQASNAYVRFKRHFLNLEAPVRIQFKEGWKEGNPFYDWYHRRSSRLITVMQLRKERRAPFFHEYVVFRLGDGHYFRVDRRQLPDEAVPLESIYEHGVEAYDTIEEVTGLADSTYSISDCLIMIKFREHIRLELVLETFWAIHRHPLAKVYTLQRYNCYFVAQTVIFFAARSDPGFLWLGDPDRNTKYIGYSTGETPITHYLHKSQYTDYWYGTKVDATRYFRDALPRTMSHIFQQLDICDQGFHAMCLTHLKSCLLCLRRRTPLPPCDMTFNAAGKILKGPGRRMEFDGLMLSRLLPSFRSSLMEFWRHRLLDILKDQHANGVAILSGIHSRQQLLSDTAVTYVISKQLDMVFKTDGAIRSSWIRCVREALQQLATDLDPIVQRVMDCPTWSPSLTPGVNAEIIARFRSAENWVGCVTTFLESEYAQLEEALKDEIVAYWSSVWCTPAGRPTTMLLGGRSNQIAQALNEVPQKGEKWVLFVKQRWKRGRRKLPVYDTAVIEVVKDYLDGLLMAHCVRVEQYKFWLRCTKDEVYKSITRTRGEIWEMVEASSGWTEAGGV